MGLFDKNKEAKTEQSKGLREEGQSAEKQPENKQ